MAWLRLIRWPNLLIIALTQFVAWWCLVWFYRQPALLLTPGRFILLCASTMLVAAGGYTINDYFDIRIDTINKPDKVILERDIPRRLAIMVHSVVNVLALLLAALIALPAGHPEWLLLQGCCTLLLWRYSTTWKRKFAVGNVMVALMTGLTIVTLIIYEPVMHAYLSRPAFSIPEGRIANSTPNPVMVLGIFAAFAFLLTWMREIVKDMEDYKGDDAEGCVTMPIQWGLLRSTRFVQGLGILVIVVLALACAGLWRAGISISLSAIYLFAALIIPLSLWLSKLQKAATTAHYHRASTQIKWIMVSGVVSLLVLHLIDYG